MSDALITEAAHHLFDKFPEAVKKVMTEVSCGKPTKFNFSSKWLHNWKKKHRVGYIKAKGGEAGSAPIESITYAQLHLPNVLECVPEECIFNVDESGLLYNQKPKYRLGTEALKG